MTPAGYVFLCSNKTEANCFKHSLFGGKVGYKTKTGEIPAGIPLFLYNYDMNLLKGGFVSTSKAEMNIMDDPWDGGKYPWQIRFSKIANYHPLMKSEVISVTGNFLKYPKEKLTAEMVEKLTTLFQQKNTLTNFEQVLRQQTTRNVPCKDGHMVRSNSEKEIDDWLYDHRLSHAYEAQLPFIEKQRYCDFIVHRSGKKDLYIEFWGKNDQRYLQDKQQKIELYHKYNLELLGISYSQRNKISKILAEAFSK